MIPLFKKLLPSVLAPAFEGTDLAVVDTSAAGIQKIDDSTAQMLAKLADYLPYVTVTTYNSSLVTDKGLPAGRIFICQGESNIDCGVEVSFAVIAERPKAMRFGKTGEAPQSYFDVTNPEFKKIIADSGVPNSGAMAGLEFLVWFPTIGEGGTFAGLFCGNKSLKKEAPFLRDRVGGKAVTAKATAAKNSQGSWVKLTCSPCTTPFGSQPDPEELAEQVRKFQNPKSSEVESATGNGGSRAR